ncbi:FliM/FliN family flagellar motor switch protein [Photobacterium sp. BZF1]|uniref:FliM/FliN family flagellar motor switch protein n=1 Tax=Photobacterium sp. BZF1 TaxID=1904457 RepID=UPI0016537636|nr:FliM/FliN family flagellar motor switch protein [Photobacterium sp. BZF1]MBC7001594.1 FliM/FliN family flagellar motor switch protein [Photobacterium sp. BZF1]
MADDKKGQNVDDPLNHFSSHDELPELDDFDLGSLSDNEGTPGEGAIDNVGLLKSIPVDITVEVARKTLILDELINLSPGSVVMLEKYEGDPVDIKINGTAFGTGEIVSNNGQYGVRLLSIIKKHRN